MRRARRFGNWRHLPTPVCITSAGTCVDPPRSDEPAGNVEVVAEGGRAILDLLLERLRDGPGFAQVLGVTSSWSAPSREFDDFTIRY